MSLALTNGFKKNKALDLGSLAFVAGVLALTPLIVDMVHVAPAKGPDKNPTVLLIFLIFLATIGLLSLAGAAGMVRGSVQDRNNDLGLAPYGLNLLNILSKAVAGLFLVSGFVKLQDPVGFGYKLDDYWDFFNGMAGFFPNEAMKSVSVPIAAFVSVFEVALAFALITGYRMRVTAWLLLLLLLFFTFLTGLAAFTGELQDCGCFGDALKLEPIQTFGKDVLLLLPGVLIWLNRRRIHPYYRRPLPGAASWGSFVVGTGISLYCYWHLDLLDFRGAYKVGQDLCYNSTHAGEDGEIYAHDFTFPPESTPVFCDRDFCKGPWLLIVMYDMEQYGGEHFDAAAKLAAEIKAAAPDIQVVGGTNTGPSGRKKLNLKFAEDFCWNDFDQKVVRTIIRSSPGFVFVQDGIVQKKWHYHDMPTVEQLRKLAGPAPVAPPIGNLPAERDSLPADSLEQP